MGDTLEITKSLVGDVAVLAVAGDLDVNCLSLLRDEMEDAREEGHANVVLDLSGTEYVTSTAVGLVVKQWKELRDHGGDLKLCGVSPFIRKTLAMLGVERIVEIHATPEEAAASCE